MSCSCPDAALLLAGSLCTLAAVLASPLSEYRRDPKVELASTPCTRACRLRCSRCCRRARSSRYRLKTKQGQMLMFTGACGDFHVLVPVPLLQ